MGCLIGGAAGNLIDRLFRGDAWLQGSVVDFIDFQWFPIFNVADIAVNVGAAALILNSILVSRSDAAPTGDDGTVERTPDRTGGVTMIDEVVPAALDGERLDRIVALIADVSRSDATALIAAGGATRRRRRGDARARSASSEGQQIDDRSDAAPHGAAARRRSDRSTFGDRPRRRRR